MRNLLEHPIDQHEVMDTLQRIAGRESMRQACGDLESSILQSIRMNVYKKDWFERTFDSEFYKWKE